MVKARKQHEDTAFYFVSESGYRDMDMTKLEYQSFMRRRKLNGMIQNGEKYYRYAIVDGDDLFCCRESQDMREICLKYDLFPEC